MTTPLTLTRPARIHCLARFRGVPGCLRSTHSRSGLVIVILTLHIRLSTQKPAASRQIKLRQAVSAWHRTCHRLTYNWYRTRPDGSLVNEAGTELSAARVSHKHSHMTILDLIKATVVCGVIAFLIYSYPIVGQIVLIGFLGLLWLLYVRQTIASLRRR
jgi:hypothetical protein